MGYFTRADLTFQYALAAAFEAARDSLKQAISVLDHSRLSGTDEIRQKLHDLVASG
jgi:hypothetical protein